MVELIRNSVMTGWDTVEDFGKRIAGLAAFVVVAAGLFPVWAPSQPRADYSRMEFQLSDHGEQLKALKEVPSEIAVLQLQARQTAASIETISNRQMAEMAGMLTFLASWLVSIFDARKKREN